MGLAYLLGYGLFIGETADLYQACFIFHHQLIARQQSNPVGMDLKVTQHAA